MIRLRIEKEVKTFSKEGLIWYKSGRPYQVIIEQTAEMIGGFPATEHWVPVEVIDEERKS